MNYVLYCKLKDSISKFYSLLNHVKIKINISHTENIYKCAYRY